MRVPMSEQDFSISHNNLLAEIDTNVFGNKELLKAEIKAGFLEGIREIAKDIAIQLIKDEWQLPERIEDTSYVEEITAQIAKSFSEDSTNQEAWKSLAQQTLKTSIPVTEPKLRKIVPIPSSALMFSSMEAYLRKDLWRQNGNGIAYLHHQAKNNPKNYIEHYITSSGDITLLPWNEAQQIIDKFGFTTAKLHLIFAAHAMKQENPWDSQFHLKASDIIQELGWDKNHKINRDEKLLEIARTAFALDCLLVKAFWIEGRNKKGQIIASAPVGRMWNVYILPTGQFNVEGKIDNPDEIYITVQPGLWTRDFLNRAGAKSREALYQFGYLAQQVLRIDPYHNELALRFAIFLTLDSRVRFQGNYTVRELLTIALPKPALDQARTERRKAYNLKQSWDSAIKLLSKWGWHIEFDPLTYPEWLRPESKQKKPKGYLDKLLDAKLNIKPPAPIPELLASKSKPRRKSSKSKSQPKVKSTFKTDLTGNQIRTARKAKGWTQNQLAGFIGVSQKLISLIERGQRSINKELDEKIRNLLEL